MGADKQALLLENVQISPNRYFGYSEPFRQLINMDAFLLLKELQDRLLSFCAIHFCQSP